MWFKNCSLFTLPRGFTLTNIEAALSDHPLRDPGPLEPDTRGFVSPFSREGAALSQRDNPWAGRPALALRNESSRCALLALGKNERMLPLSVLQDAIAERIAEHEAKTGRKPGRRMRNEFRELALGELLPRAFIKRSRTFAYFDADASLLIVDSASDRAGEDVCTAIREAIGSFPARPIGTEASLSLLMSEWLISGSLPAGFELGDEVELKDPSDQGTVVRGRHHDLSADEIREHARCGKQVTQLGLIFEGRISFVLDSRPRLRKVSFLDVVADKLDAGDAADPDQILDAEFALMSLELRRLFARLDEILQFVG